MARFTFVKANCIAVGSFNIYVVQPQVLHAMGILTSPVAVTGDLTMAGIKFEAESVTWTVRPDKLVVETERFDVDCGAYVGKLLTQLKWTPMMAVGFNYSYTSKEPDGNSGLLCTPNVPEASQRSAHVAIEREEVTLNIQLSRTPGLQELSLNVNYDLSRFRKDPLKLSEMAATACSSEYNKRDQWLNEVATLAAAELTYE